MRSPITTTRLPGIRASASRSRFIGNTSAPRVHPAEGPLDRVEEILGDVVRVHGLRVALVLPLAAAVAGEHEHARGSRRVARGHVGELVADHDRRAEVEAQLRRGALDETGPWLAAVALGPIRWL